MTMTTKTAFIKPGLQPAPAPCSCGCAEPHKIATRTTADGVQVEVWSDGSITRRGIYLRGLGAVRSCWAVASRVRAVRLMMGDFSAFDAAEIPALIKACAATYTSTWSSEESRRLFVLSRFPVQS